MAESPGLRVVHLIASRQRRGAEVFASDLVRALSAAGIDQRVVVLRDHGGDVISFDAPVLVLGAGLSGPLRMDLGATRRLHSLVRSIGADVLQAHGGEALKYAVPATFRTGCKVVYRRIGTSGDGTVRAFRLAGHHRLVRRAAGVVAVSEAARSEMVDSFGVPEDRVTIIPNGVDRERSLPARSRSMVRRELDIDEGAEVVVSVGALNWEKDPLAQLEVFGRVAQDRPRSVLVMVGQGPLEDATRQATEHLHLAERVRMLGVRNDVPDILAASDVLLLASKTEGMPGVVIEAGIANLPVAGYRLSGVPEVVVNGSTGLLARAGDVDGLATCVTKVLAEAESRVRMGRAAHRRCIERFTMESIAPSYLEVYRRVTNSPRMAQEVEEKL